MTLLVSFHSSSRQVFELCEYLEFPSIAVHSQPPSQHHAAYVDIITVLKIYQRSDNMYGYKEMCGSTNRVMPNNT